MRPRTKKPRPRNVEPTNRVVAYVRVSTGQQADDGYSLDAQQEKLAAYAKAYGLEIVATEIDAGLSASTADRPGLQAALARLDAGEASALLVVRLDRLTRSVRDLDALIESYFRDFRLLSLHENVDTHSAMGRAVLKIITAMSEWEREMATERTAAVMQHLKASKKYTGGWPPFGYKTDDDGNLIECLPEKMTIERARALRAAGHTLEAIACALGTNTRTGKPFGISQVRRMM